jgi:hypothetical protein
MASKTPAKKTAPAKKRKGTGGTPAPARRKAATRKKATAALSPRQKLDAFGIEAVLDAIHERKTMTSIASLAGVSIGTLQNWLEHDPERSARAREARELTAKLWDEKAEAEIRKAKTPIELAKARELAHHYRWRAAKIAPKTYGDRMEVEHSGEQLVTFRDFTGRKGEQPEASTQ